MVNLVIVPGMFLQKKILNQNSPFPNYKFQNSSPFSVDLWMVGIFKSFWLHRKREDRLVAFCCSAVDPRSLRHHRHRGLQQKKNVLPNESVGLLGDVLCFLCVVFGSAKEYPGVVLCIILLIFFFCVFVILFLENNETFAVLRCKMVDVQSF